MKDCVFLNKLFSLLTSCFLKFVFELKIAFLKTPWNEDIFAENSVSFSHLLTLLAGKLIKAIATLFSFCCALGTGRSLGGTVSS